MSSAFSHDSISLVLPVRNEENVVTACLTRLIGQLRTLGEHDDLGDFALPEAEIMVVDDGSRDSTPKHLVAMQESFSQIRIIRHDRPRGLESAGQTGLERATGTLVLVLEDTRPVRGEDLRQLIRIARDPAVVAARVESRSTEPSAPLLRRLRCWGTHAENQFDSVETRSEFCGVQMIRRGHLNALAGPKGGRMRLKSETSYLATA
ncbi:glycosyltransferase [Rubripirellula amarantea]|uniref:Undecaprenyl-phosphate 4-deoxy-4-formamido-L-arabinose transferase n=1 Tax=Rubripirellula amarantea TaxID=2527999 RepID=A0A5C5WSP8_9BACT|nr:glycosyltransferase [Rubripirellula amarantea]MDA8745062.1 glycosyltransferase [Rubripirellula amarantea]TWT53954.1 Undecaprenyl-phosphate 4-deoxy-4-formamido-L-arabinose transferase [Rubripirellula amarantea]